MAGEAKTEKATPKKRRDERKKGHVFLSKDAIAVASLFSSALVIRLMFALIVAAIYGTFRFSLQCVAQAPTIANPEEYLIRPAFMELLVTLLKCAGPLLIVTVMVTVIATFAQTKMLVSAELIKPKFNRISPLQGFKRLFSLRSLVDAAKGILKISVLLYLIYSCLMGILEESATFLYLDINQACQHFFTEIFFMMLKVGLAFLALAALDYLYQWWDYEREMKMSKQEIKEEYKQIEGDPQIKGKIKEMQRRMAQSRMMQQVPQADVVIRNPNHFAVALRYKLGQDNAPIVLAKGMDELALRIVRVAEEHSVTVIENVPVARALYAQADLNREIPPELYTAVAEVMVYIYRLDGRANQIA